MNSFGIVLAILFQSEVETEDSTFCSGSHDHFPFWETVILR